MTTRSKSVGTKKSTAKTAKSKKVTDDQELDNQELDNQELDDQELNVESKKSTKTKTTTKSTKTTAEPKARKAKQFTMLEHAKKKSMWAGSKQMQTIESYVLRDDPEKVDGIGTGKIFVQEELIYPPALLKIIDEVIVNAIDHHTHYPKQVKEIKIALDKDGVISVYNDGPGIPVEKTTNANGVEMYTPQLIAAEFLAGDNLEDDNDNIKGGTNGIGLKLVSAFSEWTSLETIDAVNSLKYTQRFLDGLTKIEPPTLKPSKAKSYTKISFMPDYKVFKFDIEKNHKTLNKILQTRAWQAAAYTSAKIYYNDSCIPLSSFSEFCQMFSENEIYETTMIGDNDYKWDICLAISNGGGQHMSIVNGVHIPKGGTHIKYIQNQLVENLREKVEKEIKKTGIKFNKNFIINNVFVFMKGCIPSPDFSGQSKEAISTPIDKYASYKIDDTEWKQIWNLLEPAIMNAFLKKSLGEVATRANRGKVVVPKYKEARFCRDVKKTKLCGLVITEGDSATGTVNKGLLNTKELHKTSPTFNYDWFGVFGIQGVPINALKESLAESVIKKARGKGAAADDSSVPLLRSVKPKTSKTSKSKSKKTDQETDAETDQDDNAETDQDNNADQDEINNTETKKSKVKSKTSKTSTAKSKTTSNSTTKSKTKSDSTDKTANATTLLKAVRTGSLDRAKDDLDLPPKRIPNEKLKKNERISSLIKVLGLNFNKTYALNEIGDKEFTTLRYGFIVGLMDQDLDGFNIFGLLATFIMTYWPSLVKRNFIRRINTPVMRFYPKSKKKDTVKEFYNEKDARKWIESVGAEHVKTKYNPRYYKGLATHDQGKKEITQMFKHINDKICTYVLDKQALQTMYIYYGDDTKPRKKALATPVTRQPVYDLKVPMSQHFDIDTKSYQRYNIIRKLLNLVDGFVTSRRKVFYSARMLGRGEIKVAGLASNTVSWANYHHGEASLEQTIVRMAQSYPNARNLPLLLPCGGFGSRDAGYTDYGAGRYIYTSINHRLSDKLFRKEDEYILEYDTDDGKRYEPKYYVPIIPYVLCENNDLPATGWAITVHARDVYAVIQNTRDMINGVIKKCQKLPMWNKDFKGEVRTYKGRDYYVGVYNYDARDNTLHITELPPKSYSKSYCYGPDFDKVTKEKKDKSKKLKKEKGIWAKELVEDADDRTSTEEGIDILITLIPGAYEILTADDSKYGNATFDAFEEYFELKEGIYNRINLVNEHGEVVEYKTYEDVFDDWYVFRKKLYGIRVERERILVDLEIQILKNMQRFSQNHDSYGITNKMQEEDAIAILKKEKYKIFNHTLLDKPEYTEIKDLINMITSEAEGASYDYILKMSYRDLTQNAYEKRKKKIEELEERRIYLNDDEEEFLGAKIWLKEIDELEKTITDGIKSNWFYGDNDYTFED